MELEWDEERNRANLREHGVDFDNARKLDWGNATVVEDTRFACPERRYWAFAMRSGRLHMVAFCVRGGRVRIISFWKANRKEVEIYGAK